MWWGDVCGGGDGGGRACNSEGGNGTRTNSVEKRREEEGVWSPFGMNSRELLEVPVRQLDQLSPIQRRE